MRAPCDGRLSEYACRARQLLCTRCSSLSLQCLALATPLGLRAIRLCNGVGQPGALHCFLVVEVRWHGCSLTPGRLP